MANASRDELDAYIAEAKIRTLFHDGLLRVREGLTTIEEIARAVKS
jgi:type II secretory ATPase GspE/PulE/Tfp pilus assembly ATPase PilB-like protein